MAPMASPSAARPAAQHNRRWLLLLLLCPVVVGIVVTLEILTPGSAPEPTARPASVPAGYRVIADAYFAYAIPAAWKQETNYTDANGDIFYGGAGGWAAESLRVQAKVPVPGQGAPAQLALDGEARSTPYTLSDPTPVVVRGSALAERFDMTRPDGFHAVVVEAWQAQSQTLLWLVVHADGPTTAAVQASLAGFQAPATGG
jgi:hypothetical protein